MPQSYNYYLINDYKCIANYNKFNNNNNNTFKYNTIKNR